MLEVLQSGRIVSVVRHCLVEFLRFRVSSGASSGSVQAVSVGNL